MSEKILITGPGKYPMRNDEVVTITEVVDYAEDIYPANSAHGWYMLSGRFYESREDPCDIIGPRIPEPDAQDRIVGVEGITPKPTAMERYVAYAEKHRPDIVVLQVRPWTSGKYLAKCWRNDSDGILIVETNRHADTPEAALSAAMDVLEGIA
jgi:hypothetical protein